MKKGYVLILGVILTVLAVGCGSTAPAQGGQPGITEEYTLRRTIPAVRPTWVYSPRAESSNTVLAFTGTGPQYAAAVQEARNSAQRDGRNQLIAYYGTLMADQGRRDSATYGLSSEVFDPQSVSQQLSEYLAEHIAQALEPQEYYTEEYLANKTGRTVNTVFVLMTIERARVNRIIDDFGNQQAADLQAKAAAEQDAGKKQQLQQGVTYYKGSLSSRIVN